MNTMSHDPGAGGVGTQLVDMASQAFSTGATLLTSLTSLLPAGGDEISAQAATAFAADAAEMLAANTAAQEELMRTGMALADIARQYAQTDGDAAGTLVSNAAQFAGQQLTSGPAANAGAGLLRGILPGEAGSPIRTQLMSQLLSPTTAQAVQSAAGAGSSVASGVSPSGSLAQGAGVGGAVPAPALASATQQNEDDENQDGREEQPPGESLL